MSDIIKLLPDSVANQIAAGEVIQRPASVVKELAENAVDSGATEISVVLRDSGRTLVQVIDNGSGMSETDARLAFERHATSKISSADDLFTITTKGFRGEALASVAAVSMTELRTRREEDEAGTLVEINNSRVIRQEPCSCAAGSVFSVKNLFYNVPARRKFLKSDNTEFRHIITEFQRVALAHPEIKFTLIHNDQEIYRLPSGNHRQRIVALFGKH
jgi:DNA mismatch repair protein MutL